MRTLRVVLDSASYDPAEGSDRALKARNEFDVSQGYTIEANGTFVVVSHGSRFVAFPLSRVRYMLIEQTTSDLIRGKRK